MFVLLGLVVGFFVAIPLGPVNIFVISQTIKRDFLHGFLAGLTTVVLDFVYCLIALVGFFHISFNLNLTRIFPYLKVVASLILIVIAIRLIKQAQESPVNRSLQKASRSVRPIFGVILLYVSNPSLYFFWLAIGGAVTAHRLVSDTGWSPVLFALSCSLGALTWYFVLVRYVSIHHHQLDPRILKRILLVLAVILFGFAAYTILSAIGVPSIPFPSL
jgi:threonine/homoserine/homoserine lactone efflux protein